MNYELAKELKDAGFPQMGEWGYRTYKNGEVAKMNYHRSIPFKTDVRVPHLEELIAACGEDFDALFGRHSSIMEFDREHWRADATNRTGISVSGSSPTEAVAKLWLALTADSRLSTELLDVARKTGGTG
jgi:hypothetical protein